MLTQAQYNSVVYVMSAACCDFSIAVAHLEHTRWNKTNAVMSVFDYILNHTTITVTIH
jgi:hypothetical protein